MPSAMQRTASRPFERVLAEATRALAGNAKLRVAFGPGGPRLEGDRLLLPTPPDTMTPDALALARGTADRLALRHAHHDPQLHAQHRPIGFRARALFDALEDARCLSLGARNLAGVSRNLARLLHEELRRSGVLRGPGDNSAAMSQALALLARERLANMPIPAEALPLMQRWRAFLDTRLAGCLSALAHTTHDQQAFAAAQYEVLRALGLGHEIAMATAGTPAPSRNTSAAAARSAAARTVAGRLANLPDPGVQPAREAADEDEPGLEVEAPTAKLRPLRRGRRTAAGTSPAGNRLSRHGEREPAHPLAGYRVYTRAHDQIRDATELADAAELEQLRATLDAQSRQLPSIVARLARRLERVLRTQQRRSWKFDEEEGVLDAARLARVLTDPLAPLSFKQEAATDFKDTVVTLLLDNSGSMRGRPILLTALCADLLAKTLERCGVATEILGFTTVEWDGGQARRDWIAAGAPRNPGRLTDLRYIIYKSADLAWRRARRNLGLLLRDDLMKDNIDGEALWWAHQRLLARRERRRILMVISDGVPLEQTTLSVNPGGYLDRHLRQVIGWIESRSPVELVAIGIGHEVGDYYSRALAIGGTDDLGPAMIDQLVRLFAAPSVNSR
jgi:cobaltochelatase CobT